MIAIAVDDIDAEIARLKLYTMGVEIDTLTVRSVRMPERG